MSRKQKTIEEEYQILNPREHILVRPDSYVGSTKKITDEMWIYDTKKEQMVRKIITFSPALLKIFDEIIVNAMDHSTNFKEVKKIKVNIDRETGEISVWNNGPGIPVVIHKEHNMYIPELTFGNLLAGSNFDDSVDRFTGGRNGYGAKLTNIYSTHFTVETVDSKTKLKYIQTWSNNMEHKKEPKITKCSSTGYTKITFVPDFPRFKMKNLEKDTFLLFQKRVYDCCACTRKDLTVEFNGKSLKVKQFDKYVDLYIGNKKDTKRVSVSKETKNGGVWELAVCMNPNSDDKFQQVSFVNGICTTKGGKHIDYICNQIVKRLIEHIKSKSKSNKDLNVRWSYIKDRLFVFLRSTVVNPAFSSQTKEELTTPSSDFGFTMDVSKLDPKFIEKVGKLGIVDEVVSFAKFKENREMAKKTDGKKKIKITGIPKLNDAYYAGTASKSKNCTLILTEGDSAKAFAVEGLNALSEESRKYYGVFPLKGKVINVRDIPLAKASSNEEVANLKMIIGLQQNQKYKDTSKLRYGSILILTDQDHDGSHIKGLVINLFHSWWPELLKMKGFVKSLATPIVKVSKGKTVKEFFTISEYNSWKKNCSGKWKIKYYKGLGTSNRQEARNCFNGIKNKEIQFVYDLDSDNSIELAFNKKRANDRKGWLDEYDPNSILEQSNKTPTFSEFVNKELIHFSIYDNERSIPSLCDGFKPSQRKVLFSCFKRNLINEIKVAQLSGYISEHAAYHHGEMSLNGTIVGMAQNFVGSNNINLLVPSGQFGTRLLGGKDASSPRYIFTYLEPITKKLFHPDDLPLLNYKEEENQQIEPEWYLPIIPTVLVNGNSGIGTGYSSDIPSYNPEDIVDCLKDIMDEKETKELVPWYRGFKGTIEKSKEGTFESKGTWKKMNDTTIKVTELPVGTWIAKYKEFLEELCGNIVKKDSKGNEKKPRKVLLKDYSEQHVFQNINFILEFTDSKTLDNLIDSGKIEKELNLTTNIGTTNMHIFDENGIIKKYNSPNEILNEFFDIRFDYYTKRWDYLVDKLQKELVVISAKVRFIEEIIAEKLVVFKTPKDQVIAQLLSGNYPKISGNYDYLISLPIYTFTQEKIDELKGIKNSKEAELSDLETKSEYDLWVEDLNDFMKEYKAFQKRWKDDIAGNQN